MFGFSTRSRRLCPGLGRREFLRVGAAGLFGLGLPRLLRADEKAAKARSMILVFLEGGPSHIDLWDMKPDAPENIRGEFKPIATTNPGLWFCEHLPMLARKAHLLSLVRSVHHTVGDHNAGAYYCLTGQNPLVNGELITRPRPDNFPPFGAVAAKLRPSGRALPDNVLVPDWLSNLGSFLPGLDAGFLGKAWDPLVSGDPSLPGYRVPGLALPPELTLERVERRRSLADAVGLALEGGPSGTDAHYRKAYELISSAEARKAFDLEQESPAVRERYGLDPENDRRKEARNFGGLPHFGQCLLLARRLIEAGVRLVTVGTGARYDQAWDTHRKHFPLLKESILPMFDRAFAALLGDLDRRGLLESTLVVAMGEFGRTPKVGQITSNAGADRGGRDHWPHCYTALFAGGGVPRGMIHGASDAQAARPARDPVTPPDIAATIYTLLGIDPATEIVDPQGRAFVLSGGTPIAPLLG